MESTFTVPARKLLLGLGACFALIIGFALFIAPQNAEAIAFDTSNGTLYVKSNADAEHLAAVKNSECIGAFSDGTEIYRSDVKTVKISYGVTYIGQKSYWQMPNLTSVSIPGTVKSIGSAAFWKCTSLKTVALPSKVTLIAASAFENCTSLTTLSGCVGVTKINSFAFNNCTKLAKVPTFKKVTAIGAAAFQYNYKLQRVVIGDKCKTITENAFYMCSSLYYVDLGKGVRVIGKGAFYKCTKLSTLILKSSNIGTISYASFGYTKHAMVVKCPSSKINKYRSAMIKQGLSRSAKFKRV